MKLDGGEQALVVREPLGEVARAGGVMVRAGARQPVVDPILEGVVHECDEAELRAALMRHVDALELAEELRDMGADASLRVAGPRLTPREAREQLRLAGH